MSSVASSISSLGSTITRPSKTIGCAVGVKHIAYGNVGSSSSSIKGGTKRDFFIEVWDISGHERTWMLQKLFRRWLLQYDCKIEEGFSVIGLRSL
ncbi:ERBB-3 BINDING PROTEIN 1-like [Iris pallida]|uniref:ERBB-3 BINDING PROTEIN 1-like n=1 Tax=Iris pallida TaxID=29817 RepID=A0AAX6ERJ2_IRIPA|nr:ERBB-3 BINDING PROTEIN 1-like [Iris pallida]KAJ6806711.1 ERBB-3 BINDING PROTEIN 1-like [Iris pallida]